MRIYLSLLIFLLVNTVFIGAYAAAGFKINNFSPAEIRVNVTVFGADDAYGMMKGQKVPLFSGKLAKFAIPPPEKDDEGDRYYSYLYIVFPNEHLKNAGVKVVTSEGDQYTWQLGADNDEHGKVERGDDGKHYYIGNLKDLSGADHNSDKSKVKHKKYEKHHYRSNYIDANNAAWVPLS